MIETIGAAISRLAEVRAILDGVRSDLAAGAGEPEVDGAAARLGRMAAEVARVEGVIGRVARPPTSRSLGVNRDA